MDVAGNRMVLEVSIRAPPCGEATASLQGEVRDEMFQSAPPRVGRRL